MTEQFTAAYGNGGERHHGVQRTSQLLRVRDIRGYSLAEDRPDVRGWHVYSSDAKLAGWVESLFVDVKTKALRYLGVALADPKTSLPTGVVLVPVGVASRPDDRRIVVLHRLSMNQLTSAPRLAARAVTRADEDAALRTYGMPTLRDAPPAEQYDSPNFADDQLFRSA